jgi:hypothetical protein
MTDKLVKRTPPVYAFDSDWFTSMLRMHSLQRSDVVRALDISNSHMTYILTGRNCISKVKAQLLAKLFNEPLEEVYYRCGLTSEGERDAERTTTVERYVKSRLTRAEQRAKKNSHDGNDNAEDTEDAPFFADSPEGYRVRVVGSKSWEFTPRELVSRNETIQIAAQSGAELDYPNRLMGGLHLSLPVEAFQTLACIAATLQYERTKDALLALAREHPDKKVEELIDLLPRKVNAAPLTIVSRKRDD